MYVRSRPENRRTRQNEEERGYNAHNGDGMTVRSEGGELAEEAFEPRIRCQRDEIEGNQTFLHKGE
jgi:hypothetical protein